MRFFYILIACMLMLSCVSCVSSIYGEGVLTHAPEQAYVRYHSIDLHFVLNGREVKDGQATVTQIPGITYPPTKTWQIRWGYARVIVPKAVKSLDVRVRLGSLKILPLNVPNQDGTYTIFLEEEMKKEGQK